MGSDSPSQWKPPMNLYTVLDYKYCKVWVRKADKQEHMEEYRVNIYSEEELERYQKMFTMRIEQPYFPATMYFINHQAPLMCSTAKTGSILI